MQKGFTKIYHIKSAVGSKLEDLKNMVAGKKNKNDGSEYISLDNRGI